MWECGTEGREKGWHAKRESRKDDSWKTSRLNGTREKKRGGEKNGQSERDTPLHPSSSSSSWSGGRRRWWRWRWWRWRSPFWKESPERESERVCVLFMSVFPSLSSFLNCRSLVSILFSLSLTPFPLGLTICCVVDVWVVYFSLFLSPFHLWVLFYQLISSLR